MEELSFSPASLCPLLSVTMPFNYICKIYMSILKKIKVATDQLEFENISKKSGSGWCMVLEKTSSQKAWGEFLVQGRGGR